MSEESKTANLSPAKRALLERMRKRTVVVPPPLIRHAARQFAPLSFAQQRMWLIQQLDPESYLYNEPRALRIQGRLDAGALERALNFIIERHEVLRTTFREDENGQLWQDISPKLEIPLPVTDLSSSPAGERDRELSRRMLEFGRQPFDLRKLPLLRAHLYRASADDYVLAMSFHHIISDGWTGGIFFRELGEFYQAELAGATPRLPELPVQYADYASWQREWMQGPVLEEELKFWRKHLEGAPPSVELPSDRPRPEVLDYAGDFGSVPLSRELTERLKELCREHGTTLFPVLLAGLNVLLARWSGQQDLVVGTISANRDHTEIENLIGCCTNFLPLRARVGFDEPVLDFMRRTKQVVLDGFAHQNCPFEKITEAVRPQRSLNVNPLYNVSLQVQNYPEMAFRTEQLEARLLRFDLGVAFLDLRFLAEERAGTLELDCEYNRHLFDDKTIEALLRGYVSVLEQMALRPQMRIREISLPHSLAEQARTARKRQARETVAVTATFTAEPLAEPLSFWMKELGIAADVAFAPYGQVFQQLLDPSSLVAGNREGSNVVLIRFSDWLRLLKSDNQEDARREIARNVKELGAALESAAERSAAPLIVAICPSAQRLTAVPEWEKFLGEMEQTLLSRLEGLPRVYTITAAEIARRYPVESYEDEYSDKLGHIPYTAAYFTALASLLARCRFSLASTRRSVIVADCDEMLWKGNCAEQGARSVSVDAPRRAVQEFLLRQIDTGRLVALSTTSPEAAVDAVFRDNPEMLLGDEHIVARRVQSNSKARDLEELARELDVAPDRFIFLVGNRQDATEIGARCPEVLCLELPAEARDIPDFLEGVWAFDSWKLEGEAVPARQPSEIASENQLVARIARELRNVEQISRALEAKRVVTSQARASWVAPRTPIEEMVAGAWSELLKIDRVGIHDDFFALGGHSLLATQVMARVRQMLNVELPLRTLFEAPTLAEFARRIADGRESAAGPQSPAIPKLAKRDRLPLSFAQQRLWFLDQLEPGNPIYNIPQMFRIRGPLNYSWLERALNSIVARHESLRTSFQTQDGEPVEVIAPRLELPLPLLDLSAAPERDREVERLAAEEAGQPFDLSRGPLLRARLLRLNGEEHVLLLTMHHIVSDRWSLGLLSQELAAHYAALAVGKPVPLPELRIQYPDFAAWQREWLAGEILEKQLEYWKGQLAGAPGVLELPADYTRAAVMSHRGATQSVILPRDLLDKAIRLSQAEGVTLYMTLLAAFQALLARYSGQEDIVVGSPIAYRNFADIEPLIGFFVNTLALRGDLSGDPSFHELLARVRETCLQAYAHQDIPFEKLVEELEPERSLAHSPIFQVMFALQNAPMGPLELPGLEVERVPLYTATSMFDMSWFAIELPEGLLIRAEYATDLFDDSRIARALVHFKTLLESITADPTQRISELSILGDAERRQVVVEFNRTETELPGPSCLPELIERSVERFADRTAVVCGDERISYRELNERANRIAHHLVGLGAGPDVLIAIFLERTSHLLPAIIGVLKSGSAYVPLDPNYPRERIAAIVQDAQAPIVLTQQSLREQVAGAGATIICLDSEWDKIAAESGENLVRKPTPENLAYVLFTSGSTGRPKGVALEHQSAATFVKWAHTVFTPEELSGVLLSTSVCFDLSIFEIFVPLSAGGKVIVVENALYLPAAVARDEVSLINTVPSAIAELVHTQAVPASVKTVNLAGEALAPSLVNEIYASTSAAKVYNLYGPTEDTTYSTYTLTAPNQPVTIGRPLPNSQAYVLDRHGNPQPIGIPGELYLAGAGLARGYYGRPDLTRERFLPNPFGAAASRMYKTGDLCRWRPEGTLEYLGRLDHQVKLRGFRIELGEIEAVLTRHGRVRQCLAMAREDEPGMKRLVAYVVAAEGEKPSEQELREHLKQRLPEFMIPSAFLFLDAFPLTPNGKINRQALPAPESRRPTEDFVAPRTPIEEVVAAIWAKVLHLERVGINDDFFALGGHSLLATQVVSRLRQSFNADISLRSMFETPTVRELAERVETLRAPAGKQGQAIPRLPRTGPLPLSFAQQRLWFLNQLEPNNPLYNVPIAIGATGQLNFHALVRALNEIVRRHEVLRTTFELRETQPVEVIAPQLELEVPVSDLTGLTPEAQQAAVRRLAIEGAKEIFNLERGPLFRASLLRLAAEEHVLLLNMHHIVSDGWSLWQFIRELGPLYGAFSEGKPSPLPDLPIQYADYAVWQREWMSGELLDEHLAYWTKQLEGAPRVLELPSDRVRPPVESYRGATLTQKFPLALLDELRALSKNEGATLFMTLLAAYQVLLERYTGQEDVVVGSPIANRTRAEIEELIGFFVNALVLRTDLSGNPSFRELLGRVRSVALDAYAHQDLPFEKLVERLQPERDLSRSPLFQVWFALQNAPRAEFKLAGLDLRSLEVHNGTSKFDLGLFVVEKPDGLSCMVEYSTDLFDESTIERLLGHFRTLLEAIAANPDQPIGRLPILTAPERQQLVIEWNQTDVEYPRTLCLHPAIEQQVERTPDAPAVVFEGEQLTYSELNARANQLAHRLRKLGVGPGVLAGICAERSLEMVIGLLGILKAGGAYVPLDPDHPRERLAMVLEDATPPVLLTTEPLLEALPPANAEVFCLDRDWPTLASEPANNPEPATTGKDPAYAIFTSGSTGKPKGVPNVHEGIVNRLLWMQHAYQLDASDRVMQKTPYSFDVSVWEFFWPLMTGACLVVARPEGHKDPNYLVDLIIRQKITTMHFVPSMLRIFLEGNRFNELTSLRRVICSGEALPFELEQRFFERLKAELHNLYGPTEASVDVTYWQCTPDSERSIVPIGRPIWNTQIYILDKFLEPTPIGVPGELHIGGVGLARGYLNRPELTAEKFIPDPFRKQDGGRLYKTGDLARFLPDGNIEYLGRLDHQVKIRGFRIELGEIEATLDQHPGVRQSVVTAHEGEAGDKRLVAYVVADPGYHAPQAKDAADSATSERVSQWAMTFDTAYRQAGSLAEATFNLASWVNSYTGQAIPREEMRVWVDATVERVLSLHPKRVWEIGCGLGLLLFRIAPRVQFFRGTDISKTALEFLGQQLERPELRLPQVSLGSKAAHEFDEVAHKEKFDTVVLNSVIQYFPDLDYLIAVLASAVKAVRPGGAVFVGDVRSFSLLRALHVSIQLYQAQDSLTSGALWERVEKNLAQESELLVSPEFFTTLGKRIPEISRVEVNLKRGRTENELNRFRYDVVLYVGERDLPRLECQWRDWSRQSLSVESLRELLACSEEDVAGISGVPNRRLLREVGALELLSSPQCPSTVGQLRQELEKMPQPTLELEDLWALEQELPYRVEIRSSHNAPGACDVLFRRKSADGTLARGVVRFPGESDLVPASEAAASNPLRQRLAGVLVPELRRYLGAKLPEYMVPAHFMLLDRMPLSPNGKVDRKLLPAPDSSRPKAGREYIAPRTPTEEMLASIWENVLHLEGIGVRDDFFALGGHSLNATQVVSRVREAFRVELPLRTLFEMPTIEALAKSIEALERGDEGAQAPPIVPVSRRKPIPLSFAQQRLWFLDQLDPGNWLYNVPRAIRLTGRLDVSAMERAINGLIDRHEILRTSYPVVDDHPVQLIARELSIDLPFVDISSFPASQREQEARRIVQEQAAKGFSLATDAILRAALIRLDEQDHVLFLNTHHIASDGWSSGVMLNDLSALYRAEVEKKPTGLEKLEIQYADYAAWQRDWFKGEVLGKQLAYWKARLEGAPPVLALPSDRPRPETPSFRAAVYEAPVPANLVEALRILGRQQGSTRFMTMLAAFECLIHYYTGQQDLVLGTDLANRTTVETEALIGFFVNLLVLRTDVSGDPAFHDLIKRVREVALGAYAHQDLPFDKLVEELRPERNLSHSPLVQVLFVEQNTPAGDQKMPGLEIGRFPLEVPSKFDMAVFVSESGGEMRGRWVYNPDLFDLTTIARMAGNYELLLRKTAADPNLRLSQLCELLEEAEKQQRGSEQKKFREAGLEKLKKLRRKAIAEV